MGITEHLINIGCGVASGLIVRYAWVYQSEHDHVLREHVKNSHKTKASVCDQGRCGSVAAAMTAQGAL
jgi:hypothetical protein